MNFWLWEIWTSLLLSLCPHPPLCVVKNSASAYLLLWLLLGWMKCENCLCKCRRRLAVGWWWWWWWWLQKYGENLIKFLIFQLRFLEMHSDRNVLYFHCNWNVFKFYTNNFLKLWDRWVLAAYLIKITHMMGLRASVAEKTLALHRAYTGLVAGTTFCPLNAAGSVPKTEQTKHLRIFQSYAVFY